LSTQKIIIRLIPLITILASFAAILTSNSCGKGLYEVTGTASVTTTATPVANAFLYATNYSDGTVSAFKRNTTTGALAFIAKQTAGAVNGPMGIAVTPQNDLAFVVNASDGNVYEYEIIQSGTTPGSLSSVGSIAAGTTPQQVAIDSTGTYVYVTNAISRTVSQFVINSQAQNVLTANGSVTGFLGTPFGVIAYPSAQFLYVSDNTAGLLYTYTIGSTGSLTQVGSAVESLGTAPGQPGLMAIAVDSTQAYLMVDDTVSGIVSVFLIQSDGTLVFDGSFGASQVNTIGIGAVNDGGDSDNNYVVTANRSGNFVQPYVRVNGILTQETAVSVTSQPTGLVIDPAGLFFYTANSGNGTIGLFGINSSQCSAQAFCEIASYSSESPANTNAGTQFVATTH
jgi:DNA-binding beta-propeller fold protein YncE